jgi:hypothetical protein
MRNLIAIVGSLFLASAAFADAPKASNGNFRRAEVGKAVGKPVFTANRLHGETQKMPKDARVMMVTHSGEKVSLVKVPLDRSQPVTKLSTKQANAMGLTTQDQARQLASKNGGLMGSKGTVMVKNDGLSMSRGSYTFKQEYPSKVTYTQYKHQYEASGITRTVSIMGNAESARAAHTHDVTPPAAPKPAGK